MDDLLVERVLRAAECVPPGRVASYGLIASLVGTGPRQVGAVMSRHGAAVAWWRVTNRDGRLPSPLLAEARRRWLDEGTPVRDDGSGCDYRASVVSAEAFADAVAEALRDLRRP
ncbi:MAG TPA: MGMT family protein [Arachnia sp.]|nr:MGMT family protein [Arachnia sp.]HMT86510.1 MGMT family protein [Arachnia sp.]